jgi:hypothetical protein
MNDKLLNWLTESEHPSVAYRTLFELQEKDKGDTELRGALRAIPASKPVTDILKSMHPDGYWLQKNPRTGRTVGSGVEYGAFATTHFCLSYLSELGLNRSTPEIERAAERYLNLQCDDGDWREVGRIDHFSCMLGYNIRTFVKLGYRDDPRVHRSLNLLLATERKDGGYLCGIHDRRYKTREAKSCIRGSVKALLAFAELPDLHSHPRVGRLIDYFLNRGGIFTTRDTQCLVNKDMLRPSFPITWRANTWEVLYALSLMGHGMDRRLEKAWEHLRSMSDERGAYILAWTPTQCPWKVGKRGHTNKWLTLYALLAEKYR